MRASLFTTVFAGMSILLVLALYAMPLNDTASQLLIVGIAGISFLALSTLATS